jgi:hypothetical protein
VRAVVVGVKVAVDGGQVVMPGTALAHHALGFFEFVE